ncbi:MAG TPA: DUF305 domain-containing protein [Blastocatellia bacterium]|nr:DUF305 domain-containing protein [Blastocatellia bacterium]
MMLAPIGFSLAQHRGNVSAGGTSDDSQEWPALQQSMEEMHTAMNSVKSSADSDVDFVELMLPHHRAAVDMAKAQLLHGKDSQMRRLAQEIIADQQSEIELMELWLKQHKSPKDSVAPAKH